MAAWVVPVIAAEMWGVTVNHVLAGIRDGTYASRHECGFVFVDVAPDTNANARRPDEPAPPTFVSVADSDAESVHPDAGLPIPEPAVTLHLPPGADDELPPLCEEEDDTPLPPRDAVRAAVSRQRRRPLAA